MTNSDFHSSADSTYEQLAEARIARQGRMLGRLRKAIKPFVDIGLARDHDQSAPDMIEAVDLAITPTHVREAREAHQNLDTDLAPSAAAASLTERLIQAAVDYESGRCSRKELSQARAAAEAAITGAPAQSVGVRLEARLANNSNDWTEIFPSQLEWVAKAGHQVRAIELAAKPPAAPVEKKSVLAAEVRQEEPATRDTAALLAQGVEGPHCSADSAIADALERCDWANVSIGNKAVIRAAVVALRAQPQPSADSVNAEYIKAFVKELRKEPHPSFRQDKKAADLIETLYLMTLGVSPAQPQGASVRDEMIEHQARFLLDRLQEFDPGDFQAERDFHGHVAPAISRLKSALAMTRPELGGGK